MFDYIFFDLDGTLTDPALGITNSFKYALKYFGLEIPSYKKLCSFIGPPLVDTFRTQFGFSDEKASLGVLKYREYFAGKGLVVATSKPEEYSVRIIEHFGLAPYFENVCGSLMDESRSKKDQVIEYALERNKIGDRSKVLMVGDRKHDILGAEKTGLKSCGVLFGYGSLDELKEAGADYIAGDMAELKKICLG